MTRSAEPGAAGPRVFGIGLSRTGTTSLAHALRILGYRTVHWPRSMEAIRRHEAAVDSTVACRYAELDRLHPGSRFILTVRGMESWLPSVVRHFNRFTVRLRAPRTPEERFTEEADRILYDRESFAEPIDTIKFRAAYRRHDRAVRHHFRKRRRDLLVLPLVANARWEPVCRFLGRPVPREPFPHRNPAP